MSSNELVLQQGILPARHRDQVDELYHQHHGWLQGWMRKRVGCHDIAADLAQDTFLRLLVKPLRLDTFSGARRYLRTVADGLCIDMWRRKSIEQVWLETLSLQTQQFEISPEDQAIIIETLCEIDDMLYRLPENVATAFILSQVDGFTYKQIALQLGVSDRTIKKYMARAMLECVLIESKFDDSRPSR